MKYLTSIQEARKVINHGRVIAYPTEAVYGLGCDPFNQQAVEKLLELKGRPMEKGLILLIAEWSQLTELIQVISAENLTAVKATWPGPVTWIFPKSANIPYFLSGAHETIAIRMTAHPIARALCADGPIVSTSANLMGLAPSRDKNTLEQQFPAGIDAFLAGALGQEQQPSAIYDVLTKRCVREA